MRPTAAALAASLPPSALARNAALLGQTSAATPPEEARKAKGGGKARVKPNRTPRPANQAEVEWAAMLARQWGWPIVRPHAMTLVFDDGDRYTPDVLLAWPRGLTMTLYEVKCGYRGPGWEQGMERFKRAKAVFPWLDLRLAEKRGDGWYVDGQKWQQEG